MAESTAQPTRTGVSPWPEDAVARYVAAGYWQGRALGDCLAETARTAPDAVCLVDGDVRITYRELLARADAAAARMSAEHGLRADDRVVIQLPNCWEFVVLTVACLRLGAVPVWALPQHRKNEITGVVAHAEAKALVVPDELKGFDHQEMAREVTADVPVCEHVFVVGDDVRPGFTDARELLAEPDGEVAFDAPTPPGDAVVTLLLSGGTTGVPKLIPRTHDDLVYMMGAAAEICRFGPDTVFLAVLPVGHGFVNTGPGILGTLLVGGRVVIAPSPSPQVAFGLIERERVTATSAVPAIVHRWLDHRAADPSADLGSLRLVQVGAARLADSVAARIEPELGCALQQVFGMGEGLLCLTRLDDPPEVVQRSQGRPVSPADEVLIVGEDGEPVPEGEPGILLARGPYTIRGYYRSPELNARAFVGDGWYRTGDIVRRTPDGNLVVTGRDKDVINRGGEKINAEEIEDLAHRVPGVSQAAAVAMPDAELGETVCLYVVRAAGCRVTLDDVRSAMLAAGVAAFKVPQRLVAVDSLPTTNVGKLDKGALRADIQRRLDGERAPARPDAASHAA
ncbi:(2,3-dihydroxybenzoyl)adenylate synthase [Saccharothrix hoggarensis]|uniref:(2,3-dihydroxybenzoyl)adenylate synthase n=1 Tax=Saccharothrix hoggarensis TaxID=913853 RepID=A0ABW3R183_9PSEU